MHTYTENILYILAYTVTLSFINTCRHCASNKHKRQNKKYVSYVVTQPYLLHQSVHDGIQETVPSTVIRDVFCYLLFLFVSIGFNVLT